MIWAVSFMDYALGYLTPMHVLELLDKPFGRVSFLNPE